MGEVSTLSKRGGCGAKYRNRIMSFLSMLHRFHISPASLVAPSPCHSSSHPPPFPLNGPNISLEPLSCIKEIYYTRNFRLCDGSEIIFFSFSPKQKTSLQVLAAGYWTISSPRAPNTSVCQIVFAHGSRLYQHTCQKNANYFSLRASELTSNPLTTD